MMVGGGMIGIGIVDKHHVSSKALKEQSKRH